MSQVGYGPVWKAWYWETWLCARKMQAVCMKVVTSSSVAKPIFWGVPNTLALSEKQHFVRDTACQSTKWQDVLKILGDIAFLAPLSTPLIARKMEKEKTVLTWCSTFHWQKARKKARPLDTAELLMKSKIDGIGCYTFGCYQLDCSQTEIACWSFIS